TPHSNVTTVPSHTRHRVWAFGGQSPSTHPAGSCPVLASFDLLLAARHSSAQASCMRSAFIHATHRLEQQRFWAIVNDPLRRTEVGIQYELALGDCQHGVERLRPTQVSPQRVVHVPLDEMYFAPFSAEAHLESTGFASVPQDLNDLRQPHFLKRSCDSTGTNRTGFMI